MPRPLVSLRSLAGALAAVIAVAAVGCGKKAPDRSESTSVAPGAATGKTQASAAPLVRVADETADRELQQAMKQARATAEEARTRWLAASPEERRHWAIKWAAPTVDATLEHVWVRPATWSQFRVEGVLESAPVHQLASGRSTGELVSFPIDELSDWVRAEPGGSREGGFTLEILEKRKNEAPRTSAP